MAVHLSDIEVKFV